MYKYKLLDKDAVYETFIKKYINTNGYDAFAISNMGCSVHMFDFLNNSRIVLYQDIIEYVNLVKNEDLLIMWNLSQRYFNDHMINHYMYAKIKKDELKKLLAGQQEDMIGNRLCFCKNKERTEYWDMLIYDETLEWCAAITHEDNADDNRLCFLSD